MSKSPRQISFQRITYKIEVSAIETNKEFKTKRLTVSGHPFKVKLLPLWFDPDIKKLNIAFQQK